MRLGELTYLTDQIVTFGFSSLELRNKAPTERNPHNSYNQLGRHDNKFLPQSELEACAN
ncbi:hypothetical protein VAA049_2108 [Vibrio cholerae]|nr:hypothetical protein VAA049_2108 [Vibrio cholerae]GIB91097.1 hypothetical protein VCSRO49_2868 [Vibrio cholerae]